MKVILVRYTPDPELAIASAASVSYDSKKNLTPEYVSTFIKNLGARGHLSPFEHASFTFDIQGISRVCSHQLVRHRIGVAFTQQSQRYTRQTSPHFVIPSTILQAGEKRYAELALACHRLYQEMVENGIPMEDARYILPHCFETRIVMTMNARELINASELRLCQRAQWEVRELFSNLRLEIEKVAPTISEMLKPKCYRLSFCPEGESCGLFPTRNEEN
jgi:thymidylate synthase (FAD)